MNLNLNKDYLEGNWKQLHGSVKEWWGRLTDDDIAQIAGRYERLVGKLQERYSYSRESAEQDIREFMDRVEGMLERPETRAK